MVILSEKDDGLVPPPPYFAIEAPDSAGHTLAHFRSESSMRLPMARQRRRRAPDLPSHVLLLIVYSTLPLEGEYRLDRATGMQRRESSEEMAIRTTRTLYWMAFCLRGVNRGFYLASMHLLRSTFLPHYMQRVRAPYSSDPFPHTSVPPLRAGSGCHPQSNNRISSVGRPSDVVVGTMQCETEVLDLFILHQLHEDVFADDTSLHTSRPERLRDLFDFMQPRARLTDLVRAYGAGAGLVAFSEDDLSESADTDVTSIEDTQSESSAQYPSEKRNPRLDLRGKLSRSSSMATLVNPPGPSSSTYTPNALPSPSASQAKFPVHETVPFRYPPSTPSQPRAQSRKRKILYSCLRVSFSPRRVGLVYTPHPSQHSDALSGQTESSNLERGGTPRTIVDIPRERDEPLERCASRLVSDLKVWIDE